MPIFPAHLRNLSARRIMPPQSPRMALPGMPGTAGALPPQSPRMALPGMPGTAGALPPQSPRMLSPGVQGAVAALSPQPSQMSVPSQDAGFVADAERAAALARAVASTQPFGADAERAAALARAVASTQPFGAAPGPALTDVGQVPPPPITNAGIGSLGISAQMSAYPAQSPLAPVGGLQSLGMGDLLLNTLPQANQQLPDQMGQYAQQQAQQQAPLTVQAPLAMPGQAGQAGQGPQPWQGALATAGAGAAGVAGKLF